MYAQLQDVQYLLSVVYDNLGSIDKRNEAALRFQETTKLRKKVEEMTTEDWITELWELVSDVGTALASR